MQRLNLGCGFDKRDGYLNVDLQEFHDPDLVADVRELGTLASDAYEEVLAIDVLEHLPRSDTDICLSEWHRLLQPGGTIVLQVPDVVACGRHLLATDDIAEHHKWVHQLWGTQAYTGDFHLAGFTDLTVIDALDRAGFHRIGIETVDGWMLAVTAEKAPADGPRHPLAVGFGTGFHGPEGDDAGRWRWSEGDATLLLHNTSDAPIGVALAAGLELPGVRRGAVRITAAGGHDESVRIGRGRHDWRADLTLEPGPTRVRFRTDATPLRAPDDARTLVVMHAEPSVTLLP